MLVLRGALRLVGLALLFGDLAVGLSSHQFRGRIDVADERVNRLHVVGTDGLTNVARRLRFAVGRAPSKSRARCNPAPSCGNNLLARNFRASGKLSQSTILPRMRSAGIAAPSAASTSAISPCGTTVTGTLMMRYCQRQ